MKNNSFLNVDDLKKDELLTIFKIARNLKKKRINKKYLRIFKNKTFGMLFTKTSTRTRLSFQVGINELGADSLFIKKDNLQINKGETYEDTARIFSRFLSGLIVRTYEQRELEIYRDFGTIPVINALTDESHPCQAVSDLFTIFERVKNLDKTTLSYIGDGNNVANSLIIACSLLGVNFKIASPENYKLSERYLEKAKKYAKKSGSKIEILNSPVEAVKNADFVYTDVWVSMGFEDEKQDRIEHFQGYQVNNELLAFANKNVKVMHCLPANRGMEITDEVMDSKKSIVFDQAENRLHSQKALLAYLYSRK